MSSRSDGPNDGPFTQEPEDRRFGGDSSGMGASGSTNASTNDIARTDETNDTGRQRAQDAKDSAPRINEKPYRAAGPIWSVLVGFIVALFILIFLAQNAHTVAISFLWMSTNANFAIVTLVIAFISVVVVEAIGAVWRHHHRRVLNEREQLKAYRSRESS